jgi:hypothetical protein
MKNHTLNSVSPALLEYLQHPIRVVYCLSSKTEITGCAEFFFDRLINERNYIASSYYVKRSVIITGSATDLWLTPLSLHILQDA